MTRGRAEERSWDRARARAEALDAAAELARPAGQPVTRPASHALLAHLATLRAQAHVARWRDVDAATRRAAMAWVVRHRWARRTVEQRRAVGIRLARAHWGLRLPHPHPPPPPPPSPRPPPPPPP